MPLGVAMGYAIRILVLFGLLGCCRTSLAEDCHEYAAPQESPVLAAWPLAARLSSLDADGAQACWAEFRSSGGSVLHWCAVETDGRLQELGTHVLRRDDIGYSCRQIRVDGSRVLVLDWQSGWQVVDFSDPAAPAVAWEGLPVSAQGFPALDGDRLYVPAGGGVTLLDLRPGEAPVVRAWIATATDDPRISGSGTSRVAVDGDFLWAACSDFYGGGDVTHSLVLIDWRNPDAPEIADRSNFGWGGDYDDEVIYALDSDQGSAVLTRMHRHWTGHPYEFVLTHDILFSSRDDAGRLAPLQKLPADFVGAAAIAGDRSWVAESSQVVRYLERTNGQWRTRDLVVSGVAGSFALGLAGDDVIVFAAEDGAASLRAALPTDWPVAGCAFWPDRGSVVDLAPVTGGLVAEVVRLNYTPSGWMGCGYVGLDTAEPAFLAPSPLALAYPMDTFTSHMVGDYAYTSAGIWDLVTRTRVNADFPAAYGSSIFAASGSTLWGQALGRLVAYDGTDPAAPEPLGTYFPVSGGGDAPAIFAGSGSLACFANGDTVIVARLDSPHVPTVTSRIVTGLGRVFDLVMLGGRLCAGQSGGLAVLDVSADGGAEIGGLLPGPTDGIGAMALDGPILYALPAYGGRLRVIDIGEPAQPRLIGETDTYGTDLLLHGEMLYVVASRVMAVRRQCSGNVSVAVTALQAAWRDESARLTWQMPADLAAVRVLAQAGAETWVVPWRREAAFCRAVDEHAPRGQTVAYEIQVLVDGQWLAVAEASLAIPPARLELVAPVPNPFNASTRLAFSLEVDGPVELTVLDAAGRTVRTLLREPREAGDHAVTWLGDDDRGRPVAAGPYFVRLVAGRGERVVKAALVK